MGRAAIALALALALTPALASAQHAEPPPVGARPMPRRLPVAPPHFPATHDEGHAAAGAHGAHGGHDEPGEINWFYGILGEKDDIEHPDLLWRKKGTPIPVGVLLINTALLFWLIGRFGAKPIVEALKKRKETLLAGMAEAGKMREEAAASLAAYQEKLDHLEEEIERIQHEMREAGEIERQRMVDDAKAQRARMEKDAHTLIGQELEAARAALLRDVTRDVVHQAGALIEKQIGPADQVRLADEMFGELAKIETTAPGGRA